MKLEKEEYKMTYLHAGQRHPYGDSYYEWELQFDKPMTREQIVEIVIDVDKENFSGDCLASPPTSEQRKKNFGINFESYISKLENLGNNRWFLQITEEYTG